MQYSFMLYPQIEEKLHHARHALKRANNENIIELCKQYLALLAEYRSQLYKLRGLSGSELLTASFPSFGDVRDARNVIRAAIEHTTQERNITEKLVLSFCMVTGYEAVETFNLQKYQGRDDWELRASGVRSSGGCDRYPMTIQQAVETAGLLRRQEHIAQNAARAFKEGRD